MKAILTKVLPYTTTKPMRIKAYTEGGNQCTTSWDECADGSRTQGQAHLYAAKQLAKKIKWEGKLLGGGTPEGYAFVFAHTSIREKGE